MSRVLGHLLLVLLPFAIYGVYLTLARKRTLGDGRDAPWIKLMIAGLTLAVVSFVASAFLSGSEPGRTYVPARLEGGRIVPPEMR